MEEAIIYSVTNNANPKIAQAILICQNQRRKNKQFIGLKNQGATCYLNSLI